jgi:hypothetical protein
MSAAGEEEPPRSIGYVSPGWPPSASFNGVLTAIGTLAPPLRARGHRVTILAQAVADGSGADESIYDPSRDAAPRGFARRALERIGYRVAPRWTHGRSCGGRSWRRPGAPAASSGNAGPAERRRTP